MWDIKKVTNDGPAWRPRRIRKSPPPPICIESAASDEEREKHRHVDNMYERKHDDGESETVS